MTAANVASTPPAWTVESQAESTQLSPTGQVITGMTVGFVTAGGTHASVFVPADAYTLDRVRSAVTARAAQITAVEGLSGGVG